MSQECRLSFSQPPPLFFSGRICGTWASPGWGSSWSNMSQPQPQPPQIRVDLMLQKRPTLQLWHHGIPNPLSEAIGGTHILMDALPDSKPLEPQGNSDKYVLKASLFVVEIV